MRAARLRLAVMAVALLAQACSPKMSYQAMAAQPRYEPYEASTFFGDGSSARPLVPGTVARGSSAGQAPASSGPEADAFPFPITAEVMARGRERFNIYCAPCHDQAGTGTGIVVRRGFTPPPSLHGERLRAAPAGYFYVVITNGFGAMPSYASQVPERDRWAIVAYIRALQLSQNGRLEDVPDTERQQLQSEGQAP